MASKNGINGMVNGQGGYAAADPHLLRSEASHITDAVTRIARITDEVSEGADTQVRSIDSALSGLNEMSASLRETATQADVVTASTDGLVSSIAEVAASIEQVTRNA